MPGIRPTGSVAKSYGTTPTLADIPPAAPSTDPVTPGRDPSAKWEGNGPLAGMLLRGDQLKGKFLDGGRAWYPVVDKWGNAHVLLVDGSYQAVETGGVASPLVAITTAAAEQACADVERANMEAQGWSGWNDPLRDGVSAAYPAGGAMGASYCVGGGPLLRSGPSRAAQYGQTHPDLPFALYSSGGNVFGQPNPNPQPTTVDKDDPWIDGVPVQLPVQQGDDAKYFGGWVTCRINRWTRTAVISCGNLGAYAPGGANGGPQQGTRDGSGNLSGIGGVYWSSWGDPNVAYDKVISNDAFWRAVGNTLAGVLEIIVGVLVTVFSFGSAAPAGVALIITGVSTIVSAWYDFEAQAQAQANAINDTVGAGGSLFKQIQVWKNLMPKPAGIPRSLILAGVAAFAALVVLILVTRSKG